MWCMRKIVFSVVIFFISFALVACNGNVCRCNDCYCYTQERNISRRLVAVYQVIMVDNKLAPSRAIMEDTRVSLTRMLTSRGFFGARVTIQTGNRIRVEVPDVNDPAELLRVIAMPAELIFRRANGDTILTATNIVNATAGWDAASHGPAVFLTLDDEGAIIFANITGADIGQQISIVTIVQGVETVISSPTIQGQITGGRIVIRGMGTAQNAQNLVDQIVATHLSFVTF